MAGDAGANDAKIARILADPGWTGKALAGMDDEISACTDCKPRCHHFAAPEKCPARKRLGKEATARKKVENVGVLAFKKTFADLMDETPVAKLKVFADAAKECVY